ncbi:hypothetical protein [Acidisoma silvae]|uniref:Uncharacterized protein n=1 Tax=Acidisoma silvae TaxID=2802396 RepID=A0A963YWS2_9PROT|nr:hypothetical protein [Acidisoma silvae]MCB8877568.1 hypothetical protein [Acidisoma silvae]
MSQVKLTLSDDKASLTIGDGEGTSLTLPAEVVSRLLPALIFLRSQMEPPLPYRNLKPGDPVVEAPGMRWFVGPHEVDGLLRVALHHPGLGWLSTPLSHPAAETFLGVFKEQMARLGDYTPPTVQ